MKLLSVLLVPALAVPSCLKEGTLGKDPFLPAPSMYVANWASCAQNCEKSLLCKEFSYKEDTAPSKGGCWLFNKANVNFDEDAKAVTGDKTCQDTEASAAAAAAVAAAAQTGPAALSDAADATVEGAAASITPDGGKQKSMLAGSSGQDHTVLYCVLGGAAAAALIAAGGYAMMPGQKARKKRTRTAPAAPAAPSPESTAEEAPALEMQAPGAYLLPQAGFVPQAFQYSQGQYMAYQPGTFQAYQPMAYQPMAYQQPIMEPTTYMPTA